MSTVQHGWRFDTMHLSRRQVLQLAGIASGAAILSSCGRAAVSTTTPLPTVPRPTGTGRVREYLLEARPTEADFGGRKVTPWGYSGAVPGPELRLTQGETLRVTLRNRLPQETTIHWHGLPIPNAMDGVPDVTQPPIKPGTDFTYDFVAPVAGTYMYHTHVGLQLDRGLYGPLIVQPITERLSYDREFVLVFDDWLDGMPGTPDETMKQLVIGGDNMPGMAGTSGTGTTGGMPGMPGMGGMPGMTSTQTPPPASPPDVIYPLYLINGKPSGAPLECAVKRGETVRLRLINPSSATVYRVALAGHRLTVTDTDGQAVEPVEVDVVRIGMGERYDVLVKANNPGVWQLAAQAEGTPHLVRAIVRYDGSAATAPPPDFAPPELTRQLLRYGMLKAAPEAVVPSRTKPDQVVPIQLGGGMGQYIWTINGQVFTKSDPITVTRDRHIRFEFQNMSMMPHPMHLHGHFFQVDNGTGRGPLKDTVMVEPMERLAIDWVSDNPGKWAFHCHNLYHAEAGMMRVVNVV